MKTEVITIRQVIGFGQTVNIKERCKSNGFVQEIRIRFYPGVENSLQVIPGVLHKGNIREDFFTYPEGTNRYISGDDDYLVFPVSLAFQNDDEIEVKAINTTTAYNYTLTCDLVVSYVESEEGVF